jgi:hypothetical protein
MVAKNALYTFLIVVSPKDPKQMITHAANVEEYVSVVTELFTAQYIKTLDVC